MLKLPRPLTLYTKANLGVHAYAVGWLLRILNNFSNPVVRMVGVKIAPWGYITFSYPVVRMVGVEIVLIT